MKFETMWIHFLSDVFRLLSSRTFATMATRRNSFSSWKLKIFMKWSIPMYVHVIFKAPLKIITVPEICNKAFPYTYKYFFSGICFWNQMHPKRDNPSLVWKRPMLLNKLNNLTNIILLIIQQKMTSFEKNTKKTVKLNVGGVYFKTSLLTLTKDPDSMLAAMFSGRFEENLDEDGSFFIDRDGDLFR